MAESMNSLARRGLVSSKGVQNAILNSTKVQKSKMASFDGRHKDEGKAHGIGDGIAGVGHINGKPTQADRAHSMPSKGARVNASQTPKRAQIDKFPGKQAKTFPAGGKVSAKGKKSVGVKGGAGKSGGGPYGGPSSRAAG